MAYGVNNGKGGKRGKDPDRPAPLSEDEMLLDEIRTRFDYAAKEWEDTRREAEIDMQYVSGNPWSSKDRKQREDAGRPCLSLDELGQYFNQVINDVRSNPRAPAFAPTSMGANEQTAQFYGDKMREIDYRSQSQIAYTTAFQDCVHRSYGWCKVDTRFEEKSFNQDIWIEDVPNPDLIIPDPDATRPTSSDMKYLFELQRYTRKEFIRDFPDATITDFAPELIAVAPNWIDAEHVQVAKYWKVETETKKLYLLQPPPIPGQPQQPGPVAFYEDELDKMPEGAQVLATRSVDVPSVCMYLTNGVEILKKPGQTEKKIEWAGSTIPYISCFGMILYVNDGAGIKRKILSMTRLARDPFMLYCYYRTSEAELVGMTPKFPYFVRRGSLKPKELENLQKSLHEPVAVIQVEGLNDTMPPGTLPEFPQRNPFEPAIAALEEGAEAARRAIQAAMGVSFLPTQAQRQNQKSGVALKQIESSGQKGSFHFVDHYEAMIQEVGVKVEDLMDKILDNARDTGIRDAQGKGKQVRINDPTNPDSVSTEGKYSVTVSTGPATASTQQAAEDFVDSLVSNLAPIAQIAGPKVAAVILGLGVKLKQLGPLGDEIADVITPPEYKGDGKQAQIPPELQQQMAQMQQENAKLKQLADKNATDLQKTQLQESAEMDRNRMDNETKLAVAELNAKVTRLELFLEERARLGLQLGGAATQAKDQAHEVALTAMQHLQDQQMAAQEHDQALQQQQQAGQQQMAQNEQQAALQPPPQAGA